MEFGFGACLFADQKIYSVKSGDEHADNNACECVLPAEIKACSCHKLYVAAAECTFDYQCENKHRNRYAYCSDEIRNGVINGKRFRQNEFYDSENSNKNYQKIRNDSGIYICSRAPNEQQ